MIGSKIKSEKKELPFFSQLRLSFLDSKTRFEILRCAVSFIMGFSISGVRLFNFISPFGVAYSAMSEADIYGVSSLMGVLTGYMASDADIYSGRYIVTAICAYSITAILKHFKSLRINILHASVASACISLSGMLIYGRYSALYFLLDNVLCFIFSLSLGLFVYPIPYEKTAKYELCASFIIAVLLAGMCDPMLFGVMAIRRAAAVFLFMLLSDKGTLKASLTFAIISGGLFDLISGKGIYLSALYPAVILVSHCFVKYGKFIFTLSYVSLSAGIAYIFGQGYFYIPTLYEVFAASVIFMLIPDRILCKIASLFPFESTVRYEDRARAYIAEKISSAADGFLMLYNSALRLKADDNITEDISVVYDRACEKICKFCKMSDYCWAENYRNSLDVMNKITLKLKKNAKIEASDFPEYFSAHCENCNALTNAINSEYRALIMRRQLKSEFSESIPLAYNHYGDIYMYLKEAAKELCASFTRDNKVEREIISFFSDVEHNPEVNAFRDKSERLHVELSGKCAYELINNRNRFDGLSQALGMRLCIWDDLYTDRITVLEAEPYSVSIGVSASPMENGAMGDCGRFFKTDLGMMYIILSDGLGTGCAAEKMSRDTIDTLEKLLFSGMHPETALKILSDHMLLMNTAEIYSATVDLLCIDLFSGKSVMYKSGSPCSYIKSGGRLHKIKCESFLPGLLSASDFKPDKAHFKLSSGDTVIIISDGILPYNEDKWLADMLNSTDIPPKELSRKIIRESISRYGKCDDMTCICIRFDTRT